MHARTLEDAIRADPDDDALRLVYADWLADHGDAPHGAFIKASVEAARHPITDPAGVRPRRVRHQLWRGHHEAWRAKLPVLQGITWGHRFERGLLSHAEAQTFALLTSRHGAVLSAHTHLTSVQVPWPIHASSADSPVPETLRRLDLVTRGFNIPAAGRMLANAPWLARLRAISIRGNAGQVPDLLASPYLDGLEHLALEGVRLDEELLERILGAAPGSVRSLRLLVTPPHRATPANQGALQMVGLGQLSSANLGALLRWEGLSRLEALDLSHNEIETEDFAALLASDALAGIVRLGLPVGYAIPFGVRASLRPLSVALGGNSLSVTDAEAFAAAPWLSDLVQLDTGTARLGAEAADALARGPYADTLRCWWNARGSLGTLGRISLPSLHTLTITDSDVDRSPMDERHGLSSLRYLALPGHPGALRRAELTELQWLQLEVEPDDPVLTGLREVDWFARLEADGGVDLQVGTGEPEPFSDVQ